MIDLKIRDILDKTLKNIPLSMDDLVYLQKHKEEVQETHDLNLIELSLNKSEHEPCYKFLKVI